MKPIRSSKSGKLFSCVSSRVQHLLHTGLMSPPSTSYGNHMRAIGLVIVLLGVMGSVVARSQEPKENHQSVIGTWRVNVYGGGDFNFVGLETFHQDGSTTELDTSVPSSQQTTGLGVWETTGKNTVAWYEELLEFDSSGNPIGRTRVNGTVTLSSNGKHFTAVGTWDEIDNNGNVIPGSEDTYTATATRMHVVKGPLP